VCGYHRKYALRLPGAQNRRGKKVVRKHGPASRYDTPELVEALRNIWIASDQLCSKRLKAALLLWLPHYKKTSSHPPSVDTPAMLDSMATIDRLLKPIRVKAGTLLNKLLRSPYAYPRGKTSGYYGVEKQNRRATLKSKPQTCNLLTLQAAGNCYIEIQQSHQSMPLKSRPPFPFFGKGKDCLKIS
jgi:hypothetical protein